MREAIESRPDLLAGKRLVFLIGAPRSGTTWLQLMLASTPEVASATRLTCSRITCRSSFEGGTASVTHRAT